MIYYHYKRIDCNIYHERCSISIKGILCGLPQMNQLYVNVMMFIGIKSISRSTTAATIYYCYIVLQMKPIKWISIQHLSYHHHKQQEYEYMKWKSEFDYRYNYYKEEEKNDHWFLHENCFFLPPSEVVVSIVVVVI